MAAIALAAVLSALSADCAFGEGTANDRAAPNIVIILADDKYFQDASLRVTSVQGGPVPLVERRSVFLAPGDWSGQPHNLLPDLKNQITPAYGLVPADGDAWTILATAPSGDGGTFPNMLARRYGRGMIVVGGDDIRLPPSRMLENFLWHHEPSND